MIVGAALLVLVGLGLFVAGLLTGVTAFYWGCVAVCVLAAALLFLARRPSATPADDAADRCEGDDPGTAAEAPETVARRAPKETAPIEGRAVPDEPVEGRAVPDEPVEQGEPAVEQVEVTDLLLVVELTDEVLVVDERPRYHLEGCRYLRGHEPIPIPLDGARADGFTPCGGCTPDRQLADRARTRRAAADG